MKFYLIETDGEADEATDLESQNLEYAIKEANQFRHFPRISYFIQDDKDNYYTLQGKPVKERIALKLGGE